MVTVILDSQFKKKFKRIKYKGSKILIIKQIKKLKDNPNIGKPMKYSRKGTREIYINHYRLSYSYIEKDNLILILDFYHKDEQ